MKKFISVAFIIIIVSTFFGCEILDHEHIFSKEWTYDKEYHWHESECGHDVTSGKTEHIFTDGRCDFCNYIISNENNTTSLPLLSNRYEVNSAPIVNDTLPIIASSTDFSKNYYLIDAGYIKNVPIFSTNSFYYNGISIPTISFSNSNATTISVGDSISKTVTESISMTNTNSITYSIERGLELGVEGGFDDYVRVGLKEHFKVSGSYSREWGTEVEKQNSMTNVHTVEKEIAESFSTTVSCTIGGNGEKVGHYRYSLVTVCDVYYLVTTNRDNTILTDWTIVLCAREDKQMFLDYSEDGKFGKESNIDSLDLPENFYKNLKIPTKTITNIVTLDENDGYTLEQKEHEVTLGLSYQLPIPERYNYAFAGWYSSPNGQGICYADYNGNSLKNWSDSDDKVLYAHWILKSLQLDSTKLKFDNLQLGDQKCYSKKTDPFSIDLDIKSLREIGYKYLQISISGTCSDYDYKMNERTRYLIFSDALRGDLLTWKFIVKGFNGVEAQKISIENVNSNGSYQLQLVSDQSDAYNEKLKINNIVITISAVK